jgi:hypothetical protein
MGPIDFTVFKSSLTIYSNNIDYTSLKDKLIDLNKTFSQPSYVKYIQVLANELKKIIEADHTEIQSYKTKFDQILNFNSRCILKKRTKCGTCAPCVTKKFSASIQQVLNYTQLVPKLITIHAKINLKTCYICNAQYAITVTKDHQNKRNTAKYEFDHVLPKSIYPCFSMSFYNLFPICGNCNGIKLNYDLGVNFHNPKDVKNAFTLKINDASLLEFLEPQSGINGKLKIDLIDSYKYLISYRGKKLSDKFDLIGIYNAQTDLVEDLIHRKLKYSEAYKNTLVTSFPDIFEITNIDDRIVLGTYSKGEGIHKRPMSKFLQDVDQQLEDYFQKKIASLTP